VTLARDHLIPRISDKPNWFLREVLQGKQMNFQELASYIPHTLKQSGVETIALQVQFYRKFSVPLFALIMSVISIPFAFLAGNRGAMAGVGISFVIAIRVLGDGLHFAAAREHVATAGGCGGLGLGYCVCVGRVLFLFANANLNVRLETVRRFAAVSVTVVGTVIAHCTAQGEHLCERASYRFFRPLVSPYCLAPLQAVDAQIQAAVANSELSFQAASYLRIRHCLLRRRSSRRFRISVTTSF
jgi:Lipopolysaccharide export system permease LptF/LptG